MCPITFCTSPKPPMSIDQSLSLIHNEHGSSVLKAVECLILFKQTDLVSELVLTACVSIFIGPIRTVLFTITSVLGLNTLSTPTCDLHGATPICSIVIWLRSNCYGKKKLHVRYRLKTCTTTIISSQEHFCTSLNLSWFCIAQEFRLYNAL